METNAGSTLMLFLSRMDRTILFDRLWPLVQKMCLFIGYLVYMLQNHVLRRNLCPQKPDITWRT